MKLLSYMCVWTFDQCTWSFMVWRLGSVVSYLMKPMIHIGDRCVYKDLSNALVLNISPFPIFWFLLPYTPRLSFLSTDFLSLWFSPTMADYDRRSLREDFRARRHMTLPARANYLPLSGYITSNTQEHALVVLVSFFAADGFPNRMYGNLLHNQTYTIALRDARALSRLLLDFPSIWFECICLLRCGGPSLSYYLVCSWYLCLLCHGGRLIELPIMVWQQGLFSPWSN